MHNYLVKEKNDEIDYSCCEQVLDIDQFRELISDVGLDCMSAIIAEFLVEIQTRQEQILDAQGRFDIAGLKTVAHPLKGSSGSMGAKYIYQASRSLEVTCVEGKWHDVKRATEEVSKQIQEASLVLGALAAQSAVE